MMKLRGISILLILMLACSFSVLGCNKTAQLDADEELLLKYDWSIMGELAEHRVTLPTSFESAPGQFPIPVYWAYNNELSKAIDLDIEPYLGNEVIATVYELKEELPSFLYPYKKARGVVIKSDTQIIGAWIDKGRHYGFACSLDRRSFKDIVGREWGEWLLDAGVVDIDNELEKRLSAMLPEQIIETYYNAIDEQDYGLARACFSKRNITYSLFTNMDYSDLFNESYSEAYVNGIENIEAIKMEDAKPYDPEMGKDFVGYAVYLDIKFRKEIIQTSGKNKMFVILTNEVEDLGWRIHSIGTGP